MHGKGKYITHTGSKYIGTFKDGKIFKGTWFFDGGYTHWEQTGTFTIFIDSWKMNGSSFVHQYHNLFLEFPSGIKIG